MDLVLQEEILRKEKTILENKLTEMFADEA
jgi:hypothetical protein